MCHINAIEEEAIKKLHQIRDRISEYLERYEEEILK
jgi:hypothetical protein